MLHATSFCAFLLGAISLHVGLCHEMLRCYLRLWILEVSELHACIFTSFYAGSNVSFRHIQTGEEMTCLGAFEIVTKLIVDGHHALCGVDCLAVVLVRRVNLRRSVQCLGFAFLVTHFPGKLPALFCGSQGLHRIAGEKLGFHSLAHNCSFFLFVLELLVVRLSSVQGLDGLSWRPNVKTDTRNGLKRCSFRPRVPQPLRSIVGLLGSSQSLAWLSISKTSADYRGESSSFLLDQALEASVLHGFAGSF
mmetsp:Transcript_35696/g.64728  ORF Transcript_35696/g.64728 Transcript_35696/m.64728 type:complete len:249 (+) Transcript_35696:654-1400(+)